MGKYQDRKRSKIQRVGGQDLFDISRCGYHDDFLPSPSFVLPTIIAHSAQATWVFLGSTMSEARTFVCWYGISWSGWRKAALPSAVSVVRAEAEAANATLGSDVDGVLIPLSFGLLGSLKGGGFLYCFVSSALILYIRSSARHTPLLADCPEVWRLFFVMETHGAVELGVWGCGKCGLRLCLAFPGVSQSVSE